MAKAKKKPSKKKTDESTALILSGQDYSGLEAFKEFGNIGAGADIAENLALFDNDLLIPKLQLVHTMSEVFKKGQAKYGEYINSITGQLLWKPDDEEGIHFLVIRSFKRWHTFEIVIDRKTKKVTEEFLRSDIMSTKNIHWKYQDTEEGQDVVRKQVISAIVLLRDDLEKGLKKPYIVDFKSTSKMGGRRLVTDLKNMSDAGLPSMCAWFELTATEESFAKGETYVKQVRAVEPNKNKVIVNLAVEAYKDNKAKEGEIVFDDRDLVTKDKKGRVDNSIDL